MRLPSRIFEELQKLASYVGKIPEPVDRQEFEQHLKSFRKEIDSHFGQIVEVPVADAKLSESASQPQKTDKITLREREWKSKQRYTWIILGTTGSIYLLTSGAMWLFHSWPTDGLRLGLAFIISWTILVLACLVSTNPSKN